MREVVLDTETTGLDFNTGDKIVEIGIIELHNHVPTGKAFHHYLNPERESNLQALKIHGLTNQFLKDKPKFIDIADQFIDFISDSKIIIHNANFDIGFINTELRECDLTEPLVDMGQKPPPRIKVKNLQDGVRLASDALLSGKTRKLIENLKTSFS